MNKETYIIKETEENTWSIINENGEVINTITKDTIVKYCNQEMEDNRTECISADEMIDCVWWNLQDDYDLESVDDFCQDWEKFTAWFDYICIEYLTQEITAIYKQRLDHFE